MPVDGISVCAERGRSALGRRPGASCAAARRSRYAGLQRHTAESTRQSRPAVGVGSGSPAKRPDRYAAYGHTPNRSPRSGQIKHQCACSRRAAAPRRSMRQPTMSAPIRPPSGRDGLGLNPRRASDPSQARGGPDDQLQPKRTADDRLADPVVAIERADGVAATARADPAPGRAAVSVAAPRRDDPAHGRADPTATVHDHPATTCLDQPTTAIPARMAPCAGRSRTKCLGGLRAHHPCHRWLVLRHADPRPGPPDLDWRQLWPILLIGLGAWIVLGAVRRTR